jgi:hypothetical protein
MKKAANRTDPLQGVFSDGEMETIISFGTLVDFYRTNGVISQKI